MKLAEMYMPLANRMAVDRSRSLPPNVTVEEVKSAAYYALVDSARRYDPNRGVSFPAYARLRISGEISELFHGLRSEASDLVEAACECKQEQTETDDFFDFVSREIGDEDGKMLRMYYVDGRSLREVGMSRGVGESRASQVLKSCHEKLRRSLRRKGYR